MNWYTVRAAEEAAKNNPQQITLEEIAIKFEEEVKEEAEDLHLTEEIMRMMEEELFELENY